MSSGKLTTHILDATHGCPARKVKIVLSRLGSEEGSFVKGSTSGEGPLEEAPLEKTPFEKECVKQKLCEVYTNSDGRTDSPLLVGAELIPGVYELEFHIGAYFQEKIDLGDIPFLNIVPIRFGINDAKAHYHVPLLASPYSYSTYRGS